MSTTDIFAAIRATTPAIALTNEEEAELVLLARNGDKAAAQQLLSNYIPALSKEIGRVWRQVGESGSTQRNRIAIDDLRSAAIHGFYDALAAHDVARNPRLAGTLDRYLRGAITSVRDEYLPMRVPETQAKVYRRALAEAEGDVTKARILAPTYGMPADTFDAIARTYSAASRATVAGSDGERFEGGPTDRSASHGASFSAETVEEAAPQRAQIALEDLVDASRALDSLQTPVQRLVIETLYGIGDNEPLSEREAAAKLGLSRTTLQRTRDAALLAMRDALGASDVAA